MSSKQQPDPIVVKEFQENGGLRFILTLEDREFRYDELKQYQFIHPTRALTVLGVPDGVDFSICLNGVHYPFFDTMIPGKQVFHCKRSMLGRAVRGLEDAFLDPGQYDATINFSVVSERLSSTRKLSSSESASIVVVQSCYVVYEHLQGTERIVESHSDKRASRHGIKKRDGSIEWTAFPHAPVSIPVVSNLTTPPIATPATTPPTPLATTMTTPIATPPIATPTPMTRNVQPFFAHVQCSAAVKAKLDSRANNPKGLSSLLEVLFRPNRVFLMEKLGLRPSRFVVGFDVAYDMVVVFGYSNESMDERLPTVQSLHDAFEAVFRMLFCNDDAKEIDRICSSTAPFSVALLVGDDAICKMFGSAWSCYSAN